MALGFGGGIGGVGLGAYRGGQALMRGLTAPAFHPPVPVRATQGTPQTGPVGVLPLGVTPAQNAQRMNALSFYNNAYGYSPNTASTAEGRSQRADLANRQAFYQQNNRDMMGFDRADYNTGIGRIGLQQQSNAIDQGALARQLAAGGYFDQQGNLITANLANQSQGAKQQAGTQTRKTTSDAIAGGAQQTLGTRSDLSDIQKGLQNQLKGYQIGAQGERVSLSEQRSKAQDQQKQLALTAQDYGLQKDQMKTTLDRGLSQLGLSGYMTWHDIMDKINSSSADDRMVGSQIMKLVLENSGAFPTTSPASGYTGKKKGR